jgi:cellulose synthase/poly-beta-1,6-N-acetylglucosamine synthase-like glycosyltransferase
MEILLIVIGGLLTGYGIVLAKYRRLWRSIPPFIATNDQPHTFISVVIAARNEAKRIQPLLDSIQRLEYPTSHFEIIIVDDHSEDSTAAIIAQYPNICLLSAPKYEVGEIAFKKRALEYGIKHAKGELIVTTDADCVLPPLWLQTINDYYQYHHAEMMIMPVSFPTPQNAFDVFQTLDFLSLQTITGAAAHHRLHPMCNGANLAFTKKGFTNVNGYTNIDHKASGDDILLMQKFLSAFPNKVLYVQSQDAIVETQTEKSWKDFLWQRIRWASKSEMYASPQMYRVMATVFFTNLVLFIYPFMLFFTTAPARYGILFLLLLSIKAFVEYWFLTPSAKFFKRTEYLLYFYPAQPFHIAYTVLSTLGGLLGSYRWKDRKVR